MKSASATALITAICGFLWAFAGFGHSGPEQTLQLGIGSILLSVAAVLHELSKWRRM